jgi:hypothetical protein
MPDPLQRFKGGERKIPHEALNAYQEAAQAERAERFSRGAAVLDYARVPEVIKVQNDSGADRARWEVLGLDVPLILPTTNEKEFEQQVLMSGVMPTVAHEGAGRFCILLDPIKAGKIGKALVSGVTPGRVNVGVLTHTHADVTAGSATLVSGTSGGAQILWPTTFPGMGVQWAVLRLPGAGTSITGGGGGTSVTVRNSDGTDVTTPADLFKVENTGGYLDWTDEGSGDGTLRWYGFDVYHEGSGQVGTHPVLEVVDNLPHNLSWAIDEDDPNNRNLIQPQWLGVNVYSAPASPGLGSTLGPFTSRDVEFRDSGTVDFTAYLDEVTGRVVVTAEAAGFTEPGFTGVDTVVADVVCSDGSLLVYFKDKEYLNGRLMTVGVPYL